MKKLIEELRANLGQLSEKDRAFAADLCVSVERRRTPTDKQLHWLRILHERASAPACRNGTQSVKPRVTTHVGDLTPVLELFARARAHLKFPAIVLTAGDAGMVRLNVAGARAQHPGTINVLREEDRKRLGRVLLDGLFEASPAVETPEGAINVLKDLARDPAGTAAAHGKLVGRCCFCNTELTDERSTAVGYGPVCAKNWSLPFPTKAQVRVA